MDKTRVIKKANEEEIEILIETWKEKVKDLSSRGISVWNFDQFTRENLQEKYVNPEYYIGLLNNQVFGGFILLDEDIHFWPNANGEEAFYFHKFVVKSKYSGQGLGKSILDWVKEYGKENHKEYIRLDFNENREYLKNLYYGNGFKYVAVHSKNEQDKIVLAEYKIKY